MQCANNGASTPTNDDPVLCNGVFTSTECALTPTALTYLQIPINGSQDLINRNLILNLQYKDQLIQDLTERIEALENQ